MSSNEINGWHGLTLSFSSHPSDAFTGGKTPTPNSSFVASRTNKVNLPWISDAVPSGFFPLPGYGQADKWMRRNKAVRSVSQRLGWQQTKQMAQWDVLCLHENIAFL